MLSDTQTLQDYSDCIEDVMRYIREHISEPLDREVLAGIAGFSIPHFHRVFTAHVGESAISSSSSRPTCGRPTARRSTGTAPYGS